MRTHLYLTQRTSLAVPQDIPLDALLAEEVQAVFDHAGFGCAVLTDRALKKLENGTYGW